MRKELKHYVFYLLILFFVSVFAAIYLVQMTRVTGDSMEPVLSEGQSVAVDKTACGFQKLKRFDVIVFRYFYKRDQYYIKRIIGLPGETVQIRDGAVNINGEQLDDPYGTEPIREAGRAAEPILLGEDEYFVLGDNRNHSSDSRSSDVGNIKQVQILGRAFLKLWPPAWIP